MGSADGNHAGPRGAEPMGPDLSYPREATLAGPVTMAGRGLHTNGSASVRIEPAPARSGLRFKVGSAPPILLHWANRVPSRLNTALGLTGGGMLRTVEHLAASLSAFGIDNALVCVEGAELPILDGSALSWCAALIRVGVRTQEPIRRYLRILCPVQVVAGTRFVRAEPLPRGVPPGATVLDVTCRPYHGAGVQTWRGPLNRETFVREIAGSRSSGGIGRLGLAAPAFGWAMGRLTPAPALAGEGEAANRPRDDLPNELTPDLMRAMVNPAGHEPVLRGLRPGRAAIHLGPFVLGGARFADERVRHNALDLAGDLRLVGAPIIGRVVAHRPTHKLTWAFVAALAARPDAWEVATGDGTPWPKEAGWGRVLNAPR